MTAAAARLRFCTCFVILVAWYLRNSEMAVNVLFASPCFQKQLQETFKPHVQIDFQTKYFMEISLAIANKPCHLNLYETHDWHVLNNVLEYYFHKVKI